MYSRVRAFAGMAQQGNPFEQYRIPQTFSSSPSRSSYPSCAQTGLRHKIRSLSREYIGSDRYPRLGVSAGSPSMANQARAQRAANTKHSREFDSPRQWRRWLERNHDSAGHLWLVFRKKATGRQIFSYEQALQEALCFGWIDGIIRRIDGERCERRFSPRRDTANWSPSNIARMQRLVKEKRMTPAGLARIDPALLRAKPASRPEPVLAPELERALRQNTAAWNGLRQLAPSYRKQYIGWIMSAKRPETRARRLDEAIGRLAKGLKLSGQ
ncbi:MAG: hypothetical protein GF331_01650 [Chitinivibrionales bacterium]|nr:hypothetical protein [Chitinivibrionales bacterium]